MKSRKWQPLVIGFVLGAMTLPGAACGGDGDGGNDAPGTNEPGIVLSPVGTDVVVELVPVSVDAPPGVGELPGAVISLSGNDLVLSEGGHNVWLEFRIGDWDPDDVGVGLKAWQVTLDASSLTSGAQGELTAYTAGGAGVCASNADCEALLGPEVVCDPPGYYKTIQFGPGYCSYLSVDLKRDDFVFGPTTDAFIPNVSSDVSIINVRITAAENAGVSDPEPFTDGGRYAGTLTLHVPVDARGTFAVELLPFPGTQLVDRNAQFIQSLVYRAATITVQTGSCCIGVDPEGGSECLDTLMTAGTCAQISGVFDPGGTCPLPDDCGSAAPPADPPIESHAQNAKSRYLSFVPGNLCAATALQVTLVESEQFPDAVGASWWVGEPREYCENGAQINPPCSTVGGIPDSTFYSSDLQCSPHCMDFASLGEVLHVGDPNIVPGARYEVRAIPYSCDTSDPANYSEPLSIATTEFGDTITSCEGCPCGPPDGSVDIIDCVGILDRFVSAPCSPLKARVDLVPGTPDRQINVTDLAGCLYNAFLGIGYNFSIPERCP